MEGRFPWVITKWPQNAADPWLLLKEAHRCDYARSNVFVSSKDSSCVPSKPIVSHTCFWNTWNLLSLFTPARFPISNSYPRKARLWWHFWQSIEANYTKMIMELLTDSLHFRATPCANCLRGQMLQLLPVTYFVLVSQNTQLDAHGNRPNLGYS